VLDLMDQTLREVCNAYQFEKCVNIGLIFVQEDPNDRPPCQLLLPCLTVKL
jgi:hypothetical protein